MDIKPNLRYKNTNSRAGSYLNQTGSSVRALPRSVDGFNTLKRPALVRGTVRPAENKSVVRSNHIPLQPVVNTSRPLASEPVVATNELPELVVRVSLWKKHGLTLVASFLIFGGISMLGFSVFSNHSVIQQAKALSGAPSSRVTSGSDVQTDSARVDMPTEDKPSDTAIYEYKTAPLNPKFLQISKLGISKSRILRLGLTADGAVDVPKSVWDVGWYEGSAAPGDAVGSVLLVGHVAGPTTGGIFYNLHKLEKDEEVTITTGDDVAHTYVVVSKEEVFADSMNMNDYMVSTDIDKPGLTIVTCGGDFDPKTNTYNKRTVIRAIKKG